MKLFFIKRLLSITLAFLISAVISYYFSKSEYYWMPIATLFVMQTSLGAPLRQGLLRFFLFLFTVIAGTGIILFIHPASFSIFYARGYDISVGALIGIVSNLIIFPIHIDVLFRKELVLVLNSYANYLASILDLLLQKENAKEGAENKKQCVEKVVLQFSPTWVYTPGFSVDLRQGYRHFLVMTGRLEQILFSLHHIARHPFSPVFLKDMNSPLISYVDHANKILQAIVTLLNLKKITEALDDLSDEVRILEKEFQTQVPFSIELLSLSKDYIYFAALIADLKDFRKTLLFLAEALR